MSSDIPGASEEAIAAQLGISFDGRRYAYRQYRYDHFADAADYARRRRLLPGFIADAAFVPCWHAPFAPSAEDLQRMKPYGIRHSAGYYYYGNYRYDQLEAALAYAARQMRDVF